MGKEVSQIKFNSNSTYSQLHNWFDISVKYLYTQVVAYTDGLVINIHIHK